MLLLLQLLLSLLHLLQHLLRSAPTLRGLTWLAIHWLTIHGTTERLLWWWLGSLRFLRRVFLTGLVGLRSVRRVRTLAARCLSCEHKLTRCSFTLIANHNHVVPRALQELAEHIPLRSRTVAAINTLIVLAFMRRR